MPSRCSSAGRAAAHSSRLASQFESIARLPTPAAHDDISDANAPLTLAIETDGDRLAVLIAGGGDRRQRFDQFLLKLGIVEFDFGDFIKFDRPNRSAGKQEGENRHFDDLFLPRRFLFFLDGEDRPRDLSFGKSRGHARAAKLGKQIAERRRTAQIHLKTLERMRQRLLAAVRDGGDFPAVEVFEQEALENVVDLLGLEVKFGITVPFDGAIMLEIPDAAGVEHDFLHRHRLLVGGLGRDSWRMNLGDERRDAAGGRRPRRRLRKATEMKCLRIVEFLSIALLC